eukprot:CAMPEP_0170736456 /NCGR_PEP_ID=MMETSP0437-20130122/3624_1 /TAXON_ID=0 /ORGANISM="Sexangularia sp." /LENGTH=589 /DNA_ID=CAMNT_0011074819 /DNA_START=22 /DNA_END=1788 /DNA_ORIENTATION=-
MSKRKNVDMLLKNAMIIPVVPSGFISDGAIAVDGGRIVGVGSSSEICAQFRSEQTVDYAGVPTVLIPGLINTHTHLAMSTLRGIVEDVDLMTWLTQYIWPAEGALMSAEFVRDGSALSIAEGLVTGTTTFHDMYFFPESVCEVAEEMGVRLVAGAVVVEFPTPFASGEAECIEKGLQLIQRYGDASKHPLVRLDWAPHSAYACSDDALARIASLAREHGMQVHTHAHESPSEMSSHAEKTDGKRPLERLQASGIVGTDVTSVLAHMTQVTDEEVSAVAGCTTHVAHCPHSNLKLASGLCPVSRLRAAGVPVSLGTDGPASNDGMDMLAELRSAVRLDRYVASTTGTPVTSSEEFIALATLGGAKALGLDKHTGSLEVGKDADIVAVRLDALPVYSPIAALAYSSDVRVTDVWVAGKHLVHNEKLTDGGAAHRASLAAKWKDRVSAVLSQAKKKRGRNDERGARERQCTRHLPHVPLSPPTSHLLHTVHLLLVEMTSDPPSDADSREPAPAEANDFAGDDEAGEAPCWPPTAGSKADRRFFRAASSARTRSASRCSSATRRAFQSGCEAIPSPPLPASRTIDAAARPPRA